MNVADRVFVEALADAEFENHRLREELRELREDNAGLAERLAVADSRARRLRTHVDRLFSLIATALDFARGPTPPPSPPRSQSQSPGPPSSAGSNDGPLDVPPSPRGPPDPETESGPGTRRCSWETRSSLYELASDLVRDSNAETRRSRATPVSPAHERATI